MDKRALYEKSYFLKSFFHFNNFFVTPGHIPAIFIFKHNFIRTVTQLKPPSIQDIFKILKPIQELIL